MQEYKLYCTLDDVINIKNYILWNKNDMYVSAAVLRDNMYPSLRGGNLHAGLFKYSR